MENNNENNPVETNPVETNPEVENPTNERTFTQEDVNKFMAKERKTAEAKTQSKILQELGVEDISDVKNLLDNAKQVEEEKKSETEKLAEQLDAINAELESTRKEKKQLQFNTELDGVYDSLNIKKERRNHVAKLLKAEGITFDSTPEERETVLTSLVSEFPEFVSSSNGAPEKAPSYEVKDEVKKPQILDSETHAMLKRQGMSDKQIAAIQAKRNN